MNYGILCWGHEIKGTFLLQKRAIRIITNSKYNAHTDPLFKRLSLLKLKDIHHLETLKFCYKLKNAMLPPYFDVISLTAISEMHNYSTRNRHDIYINRTQHNFASHSIRNKIPVTLYWHCQIQEIRRN